MPAISFYGLHKGSIKKRSQNSFFKSVSLTNGSTVYFMIKEGKA